MVLFLSEILNLGFGVKTSSDDGVGHPWQGVFFCFSKKHVPFQKNMYIAVSGYSFEDVKLLVLI